MQLGFNVEFFEKEVTGMTGAATKVYIRKTFRDGRIFEKQATEEDKKEFGYNATTVEEKPKKKAKKKKEETTEETTEKE